MSDRVWTAGALLEAMRGLRATPDFWAVAPVTNEPFCWALGLSFILLWSKAWHTARQAMAGDSDVGGWAILSNDWLTSVLIPRTLGCVASCGKGVIPWG